MGFKKATKENVRLRIAMNGPAGSGKTYSALSVATQFSDKVAVIDTERGSASKYADDFDFDVMELDSFDPRNYINALGEAYNAGYEVVIIDSLSHAWAGEGGILSKLDSTNSKSKFNAWAKLTPQQNRLIDSILRYPGHIIVTMRTKTSYEVVKNERGKNEPQKVGLAPVQRDGVEYEFDVVIDMQDARGSISKTRCKGLHSKVFDEPGENIATILKAWIGEGPVEKAKHELKSEDVPRYGSGPKRRDGSDKNKRPKPSDLPKTKSTGEMIEEAMRECAKTINPDMILNHDDLCVANAPKPCVDKALKDCPDYQDAVISHVKARGASHFNMSELALFGVCRELKRARPKEERTFEKSAQQRAGKHKANQKNLIEG